MADDDRFSSDGEQDFAHGHSFNNSGAARVEADTKANADAANTSATAGTTGTWQSDMGQVQQARQALSQLKAKRESCSKSLVELKQLMKDLRKDTDALLKFQIKTLATRS